MAYVHFGLITLIALSCYSGNVKSSLVYISKLFVCFDTNANESIGHMLDMLLSRRSWQRERLSASELSICLSVCLSSKCKKTRFSQKLSNLELRCLLTIYRKVCKLNWAFQRTHYWIPTIQDGWDPPSWKSTWRHFFLPRVVRFG